MDTHRGTRTRAPIFGGRRAKPLSRHGNVKVLARYRIPFYDQHPIATRARWLFALILSPRIGLTNR